MTIHRVFNFSAGPAALPQAVLEQARDELLDWQGSGASVMEISHRSPAYLGMAAKADADLRDLLAIPEDYCVLFLQGGATAQFALVPMNLIGDKAAASYVDTGIWSKKAINQARAYCDVDIAATSEDSGYTTIPPLNEWDVDADSAYLHYTPNETIGGLEFHWIPDAGSVPLVADMSSTLLSRPIDVSSYGIIYAGAQKNLGSAGLTIVIVRKDLLGRAGPQVPAVFNYQTQAENDSMLNTPPTYGWYMAGLVFEWLNQQGGLEVMAKRNRLKAARLYDLIDASDYYQNPVDADCRSWMNVPFTLADSKLDKTFLKMADEQGLVALKGHRSVGGMRASIYNAMPEEGIEALATFMLDFEKRYA